MRSAAKGHEKLRTIGVGASVRERQKSRAIVGQQKVFVGEFRPVDAFPAGAVPTGEVTPLRHEIRNDPVEKTLCKSQNFAGARGRSEWNQRKVPGDVCRE